MKKVYAIATVLGLSAFMFSCKNDLKPNYQFFPQMYESVGYETYSESNAFKNGQEAQFPAKGSIKRGFVPYELPNTDAGYESSKNLISPIDSTLVDAKKGEELYGIYCAICHGEKGNGKGKLVEREKFLGVPSYADRQINKGTIFHVVTYGKNAMGSHANQLNQTERWLVADYVMKLKSEL